MPTIFSHAVCAAAIGCLYPAEQRVPWRFWVLTAICSVLPDADVIGFSFGIRYGDMFGHRGFTHSLFFAAIVGGLVATLAFRNSIVKLSRLRLSVYFTLVTASHPLLDALTNGGLGVALFAPFSSNRYFLPWRPLVVSPIGMEFFGSHGLIVLANEIKWLWLPSMLMLTVAWLYRKLARR